MFIVLLAFVLGEVIAVFGGNIRWIVLVLPILAAIKIITKKQAIVFVVIFLCIMVGYGRTKHEACKRDLLYNMEESGVSVTGTVSRMQETNYGWNIYIRNVNINGKVFEQILVTYDEIPKLKIGNKVIIRGTLKQFEKAGNPGNFDAKKYYMTLEIYAKIAADTIKISDNNRDFIRDNL